MNGGGLSTSELDLPKCSFGRLENIVQIWLNNYDGTWNWTFGDLKFTEMSCFTVSTLQCLLNEVLTRWFCMQLSGEHYDSFYGYRLYGSVSFLDFSTDFSICSTCYVNLLVLSGCILHRFVACLCCWVVLILLWLWAYVYLDNVLSLWYKPHPTTTNCIALP